MKTSRVTWFGLVCVVFWLVTVSTGTAHAQWTTFTNAPPNYLSTCLLLTDGSAMCHRYGTNQWWRLIPDNFGSYANGTWSATAPMPNGTDTSGGCAPCVYAPLYFASAVLPDGRVVVVGGEYNSNGNTWTNIGFLYNPVTNAWSPQLLVPFPAGSVGDAQAVVIDNGTMLLADSVFTRNIAAFNPATLTFTALNPTNKADANNEENWNILPDGRVLTVNTRIASAFEIYDPGLNTWTSGTTPVNLADCCGTGGVGNSKEAGPGVLRPDGTLVYFSANPTGKNAVYNTITGTWTNTAAMDFPLVTGQTYHYAVPDGPASLLPNGNVLVMANPVTSTFPFNTPSHFYEFDGTTLTQVTDSPNAAIFRAYQGRMLLLPSGQVLLTAYNQGATQDVLLYSNGGSPQNAWRPVITSAPSTVTAGNTYAISGRLFNGFSEGATYGDDATMSSNYPLVRIKNLATSHVVYARTHDHSMMGVERVDSLVEVTTHFDVPAGLEGGASELVVVVNGIPSLPVTVNGSIAVGIDIKPGGVPNSINPRSQGNIPVAILSTASFDATTQVDRASLTFGRTGDEHSLERAPKPEDVNGDGRLDLICHFSTQSANFQRGDTLGVLKGRTINNVPIRGTDSIRIVP